MAADDIDLAIAVESLRDSLQLRPAEWCAAGP